MQTYSDERGDITEIIKNADVLKITSKLGSCRARHYHKEFGHYVLMLRGAMAYYERKVGSSDKPIRQIIYSGDLFWTPPMVSHLMVFDIFDDNEFFCFSSGNRSQAEYENDLVRVDEDLEKIYKEWKL